MGEAEFYLLATFPSEEKARRARLCARVVLSDLAKFCEDWEDFRYRGGPVGERFERLLRKHRLVAEFIDLPEPPDDDLAMNSLAGYCDITKDADLEVRGNEVRLRDTVWHWANWSNIARLFYKLGATRVAWTSSEDIDFWEYLRFCGKQNRDVLELPREVIERELLPLAVAREL